MIDPGSAATIRAVAGRTYYAAYLATRDTVCALAGNPDFKVDHIALTHFLSHTVRDPWVNGFGETLEDLRVKRTHSDYRLSRAIEPRSVGLTLRDAKFILDNQSELAKRLAGVEIPRLSSD
ncbi:MAG: hypothetical protein ABJF01_19825 [bacterium]